MARTKTIKGNQFKAAVENCGEIKNGLKPGLSAMGYNSKVVRVANPGLIDGSVDIDSAVKDLRPGEPRWDYVVGYLDEAYFIEVHPADTKNVDEMVKKVTWLKKWLPAVAPDLKKLHKSGTYYWIPSGRVKILKTSTQYKKIAANNLLISNQLCLK